MRVLQRFNEFLVTVGSWGTIFFMAVIATVVPYEVVGRYVFNRTPGWGEEGALFFMVWFCLISAALAIKEDRHLRVSVIEYFLNEKQLRVLDYINYIIILIFAGCMFWEGIKLTRLTALNIMPGIGIKSSWLFASVPVAGLALIITIIEKLREILCKRT